MINNDFARFFVGYDKVLEKLTNIAEQSAKLMPNYPPFNLKKVNENKYAIEIALAGFSKEDVQIELEGTKLVITGNVESKDTEETFVFKGISNKAFTREFTLADNVEIQDAEFINGMLIIGLSTTTPESKKKKINIKESNKQTGFKNAV
jgi:HSP20 family molecular chaperone IbpA